MDSFIGASQSGSTGGRAVEDTGTSLVIAPGAVAEKNHLPSLSLQR